jgi:predicted NAD/FAD-binding protein
MTGARRRVAVVGAGISGLATAWALADPADRADVVLYEADQHFGGHAHTVDLTLEGVTHGVDTGFLVFNHATYPGLVKLFADLQVDTAASEMSFSVQVPRADGSSGLEWSGSNLDTVFAQRSNLVKPRFLRMLRDLVRFNRSTSAIAERGEENTLQQPIGDFLVEQGYSDAFRDWYLLPMLGCIWSCPTDQMLRFPVATMIRFCHNHGLIRVTDRPQWHTVRGGSRHYVQRMLARIADARLNTPVRAVRRVPPHSASAGVWLDTDHGSEHFDEVVLAGHSDQSLALLGGQASAAETAVLGAIRYHRNRAVLHTDASVLPKRPKAWAAWNYVRSPAAAQEQSAVCLHYLINRLQPLPWQQPVVVSLNPTHEPAAHLVHGEYDYAHPVFDLSAIAAQARLPEIQGRSQVWFAGAWTRYGFHEDGLRSGLAVADALRARWAADAAGIVDPPLRSAA